MVVAFKPKVGATLMYECAAATRTKIEAEEESQFEVDGGLRGGHDVVAAPDECIAEFTPAICHVLVHGLQCRIRLSMN